MYNLSKRLFTRNSKITIALLVILSIIFVNSVHAAPKNNGLKPPKAKNAAVSLSDIQSLNDYISLHSNEVSLISDNEISSKINEKAADNKELQKFTGLNKKNLYAAFKTAAYTGKIDNKYTVYTINYEFTNEENNKVSILATYDLDRKILIEAMDINQSSTNELTIVSRNMGLTFKGDLSEAIAIKNASPEERKALKEKNRSKHKADIERDATKTSSDNVASIFTVDTASANTCSGNLNLSSNQCAWVAVGYCAVAGLFGFLPGLICSIGYTYVCGYTC